MIAASDVALRLLVASALGCAVGFERERLDWTAGLRTHMLVCVGAALFMVISSYAFDATLRPGGVILDPSRVAAQVVSGIGFLGAGTILIRGNAIKGLTTAASLWAIAAVGLACGSGLYWSAAITTGLILIILAVLKPIERWIFASRKHVRLLLALDSERAGIADVIAHIEQSAEVCSVDIRKGPTPDTTMVEIELRRIHEPGLPSLFQRLGGLPHVRSIAQQRS